MSERRLAIFLPNEQLLYPDASRALMQGIRNPDLGAPAVIDVSGIPNANAACPLALVVEERCNLGQWHRIGRVVIPCWSEEIPRRS